MTLITAGISNTIYPLDGIQGYANMMGNYTLNLNLNRLSPYYLFSEATSILLNPTIRTLSLVTPAQADGAIEGFLSVGQSTLLILPHIIAMLAATMALFAAGYIQFLKQEIRG